MSQALISELLKLKAYCTLPEFRDVDYEILSRDTGASLFEGASETDVHDAILMAVRSKIEEDPAYSLLAGRLLNQWTNDAVTALGFYTLEETVLYGISAGQLDPLLATFDLEYLNSVITESRSHSMDMLAVSTLVDRYLQRDGQDRIFETIQRMLMRVAMGLAINEGDNKNQQAAAFYAVLSCKDYMASTPTLFNAGTTHAQLSSCYLTTVPDDLDSIYESYKENALLSKWAGGLGNDWTPVRAMGSRIKGTNGKSQGVVPFLNVQNASCVAVNQCFAPNTSAYVKGGVKAIKDIQIGDLVLGVSGTYREVTNVMEYDQHGPMVEVHVKHQESPVRVTAGHPFRVLRGNPKGGSFDPAKVKVDWIEAGELTSDDMIEQTIPTEVVLVENFTNEDALAYGIMLGDGHCTKRTNEFGVTGASLEEEHMAFMKQYLEDLSIHFWIQSELNNVQIRWSKNEGKFPFTREDLYDEEGNKHIHDRLAHLPLAQSKQLVRGLLITDGNVSRGKELTFSTASLPLMHGLRYQLLRHAIPTSIYKRTRAMSHDINKASGKVAKMDCTTTELIVRIPATGFIPTVINIKPLTKFNWVTFNNKIYSRVKHVFPIPHCPVVYDLIVEGDESYMLTSGLAHNGGKRKGAACAYLETWHADIEEFLELRKNTGDDRRRTHDMNTANWVPDEFMRRVFADEDWYLMSPDEVGDLHDLYGKAFSERYAFYINEGLAGRLTTFRKVRATDLWRKMLSMLFETGHPWITFKDPCNIRSPQQHIGVVHSSNLCTEITLNTSATETAVCNLGSINLAQHVTEEGQIDHKKLESTVNLAIRMLDNVIDINYYPTEKARNANLAHRPVGLGVMGFQDALYKLGYSYSSEHAIRTASEFQEAIACYAIKASALLAAEKGCYSSYKGSLWDRGIFPQDSAETLMEERHLNYVRPDLPEKDFWKETRSLVAKHGMRNSNVMAIAPTATISNICGVSQSIEPTFQNLYVKSNLSGEFTVVNQYLVEALKHEGLWSKEMVQQLKVWDGSVQHIPEIPEHIREQFKTAFEHDMKHLITVNAGRQYWVDQAISLNIYLARPDGKLLDSIYKHAYEVGLKTTYYLRSKGATSTEKATISDGQLNAVKRTTTPKACSIENPDCEACQ